MKGLINQTVSRQTLRALTALTCVVALGCGVDAPPDDNGTDTGATVDDSAGGGLDGTSSDAATGSDVTAGTDVGGGNADGGGTTDAAGATDTGGGGSTDAATTDSAQAGDGTATEDSAAAADTTPAKKLPLPDCAKSCDECVKCPATPMCVNGKTFQTDCDAICELKAFDWPQGIALAQGKCPECKTCKTNAPADAPDAYCAKTEGGVYVPVKQECELDCLKLATPVACTNGKCDGSGSSCTYDWQCSPKSEVIKGSCGKFNLCAQPKDKGGAECPVNEFQPVCSKKDGKTYANSCAMQACDLSGCYAKGAAEKTKQCDPGKMELECHGECYDSAKYTGKCPSDCNAVCAVINGKTAGVARTFRNGCIAKSTGAATLSCDGVSATAKDQCSAALYAAATKGACCPDVDYTVVKQVCASKGQGANAVWTTFRNQSEFECLTAGEKSDWTFQYLGPCICNCPQTYKPVCGKDGVTYQNACQAKCYGGDTLNWSDGACNP